MKRVMTLVGSIIGVVFDAIFSLIMLIGITAILEMLDGATGSIVFAIVGILALSLGVVALVFNAMSIGAFSCSPEKFAQKRKFLITAIVLNFVLALLLLISLCGTFNAFNMIVFLASIAAAVLIIVDLSIERGRVEKLQPVETPAEPTAAEPAESSEQQQ